MPLGMDSKSRSRSKSKSKNLDYEYVYVCEKVRKNRMSPKYLIPRLGLHTARDYFPGRTLSR